MLLPVLRFDPYWRVKPPRVRGTDYNPVPPFHLNIAFVEGTTAVTHDANLLPVHTHTVQVAPLTVYDAQ